MKPRTLGLVLIVIALIAGIVGQLRADTNKSAAASVFERRNSN